MDFSIRSASFSSSEVVMLTKELNDDLEIRYGVGGTLETEDENKQMLKFLVVYDSNNEPCGCGAIKHFDEYSAEIKRMYVRISYRRQGISNLLLSELEKVATELNYSRIVLETGARQPESIALYEKFSYTKMKCYGRYVDSPMAICYEKKLSP